MISTVRAGIPGAQSTRFLKSDDVAFRILHEDRVHEDRVVIGQFRLSGHKSDNWRR